MVTSLTPYCAQNDIHALKRSAKIIEKVMNSIEFMAEEMSTIFVDSNTLALFPPDLDTTPSLSSHCPLTSADLLGSLATAPSLQGQGDLSLAFADDGSLDILATAALLAGVTGDHIDSEVDSCALFTPSEEARGLKRKRDENDEEDEGDISLDDDLYFSDIEDDCYDGDIDIDSDAIDGICLDDSFLAADDGDNEYAIELASAESSKLLRFDYDSDEESDDDDYDDEQGEQDEGDSDDYDDMSDSEPEDCETDLDSSDAEDDAGDCPPSCVCWTGSLMEIYPIDRRYPVISPLYKKLLKQRLLRSANRYCYDCCEKRCSFRWQRRPLSRMTSDYNPSDLRVYHFRWGMWRPEDEEDEMFW